MKTLIEEKDFGIYRYVIYQEGTKFVGTVCISHGKVFKEEGDSLASVRFNLIQLGLKHQ